jgi:hypothetical protein
MLVINTSSEYGNSGITLWLTGFELNVDEMDLPS